MNASCCTLRASSRAGRSAKRTAIPSQSPPSGPSGESSRCQIPSCARRNANGSSIQIAEEQRIRRSDGDRDGQSKQGASPILGAPREDGERRQERDPHRPGQHRQPGHHSRAEEAPTLGEEERREHEQQVERLAVDRLQEERGREDGEVEHRAPGPVSPEPLAREPVEEDERGRARREREQDAGKHEMVAERPSEQRRRALDRAGRTQACSTGLRRSRPPRSGGTSRCPSAPRRRSRSRARAGEGCPSGRPPGVGSARRRAARRSRAATARSGSRGRARARDFPPTKDDEGQTGAADPRPRGLGS